MRKIKRILSALLCLALLLSMLPHTAFIPAAQAAGTSDEIVIDFKSLGNELAGQSWWNDLVMGSKGAAPMASAESAQYDAFLQYLSQNKNWTINETKSQFKNMYQAKELVINTDESKDWGLRYYAGYAGVPSHDSMYLELTVTEEQAGWYSVSTQALLETILSAQTSHGFQGGGGYGLITINDEEALAERSFQGSDTVAELDCGFVQLKEGVNTIRIRNTKDVFGGNSHGIRSLCLNKITFRPAEIADGPIGSLKLDFKAFAKKASTQSWWDDLIATDCEDIKVSGCDSTNGQPQQAAKAYSEMLQYMAANENWAIDEGKSLISLPDALKRIVIDASDNACGLRFWPAWFKGQNGNTVYSQLTFSFHIPKGAEGEYRFSMDLLRESPSDGVGQIQNMNPGGGYGDILVNGTPVATDFDFASRTGKAYRSVEQFGTVELKAGENTVTIDMTKDFNAGGNNLHRVISLCAMEFTGVKKTADAVYDFTKAGSVTEKGYDKITDYEDLDVDDAPSAPWKFDSKSGSVKYDPAAQAGVLTGAQASFILQVEASGWYQPVLRSTNRPSGGKTQVWLAPREENPMSDTHLMASFGTYAPENTLWEQSLRPTKLEAGEYILTMTNAGGDFAFRALDLYAMEQPKLELVTGEVDEKANRTTALSVYGFVNSTMDSMTGALWQAESSDPDGLECSVRAASVNEPAQLLIKGNAPGTYEVTLTAQLYDTETSIVIPITIREPAVLASLAVSVPGVQKQVARDTIQKFDLAMTGRDGLPISADEVEVLYETDQPDILAIDEESNTFRPLRNGDVTVTVTVSLGGVTLTDTIDLTVADTGENCLPQKTANFENNAANWMFHGTQYTVENEDETNALKIAVDPGKSFSQIGGPGMEIHPFDGNFAQLQPGHMYEFTTKLKIEGYKRASGAMADLVFAYQLYDYSANARLGTTEDEVLTQHIIDWQKYPQWTEFKMTVRAPVEGSGTIYAMPRIVIFPAAGPDNSLTGWEGTVWLQDLQIREVGFAGVETSFSAPLNNVTDTVDFRIKPYTTTGSYVDLDEGHVASSVGLLTDNDDVVTIERSPVRTQLEDGTYTPAAQVRLRGLNDTANLYGSVTIHGLTQDFSVPVEVSGLKETLRDTFYTLDGFEAVAMHRGETATGDLTARTTQLQQLTEQQLRSIGSVYLVSSDTDVATVDQATGDVTFVGEGSAVITAYAMIDGVSKSDSVLVTVRDDTDLTRLSIHTPVDYVGTGNSLQLSLSGQKASGGAADMSRYQVAWSLDEASAEAGVARIDASGMLHGIKAGTVTVKASVGVMRTPVEAQLTVEVVDNNALAGGDIILDFTDGHLMNIPTCTLEENGVRINREESYQEGANIITYRHYGFAHNVPTDGVMAFDFIVEKDGWYAFEAGGGLFEGGNINDIYIDNIYMGTIDFYDGISGMPYSAKCVGNTVYLTAGTHTYYVKAATAGIQFLGKLCLRKVEDPGQVIIAAEELPELLVGQAVTVNAEVAMEDGTPCSLKTVYGFPNFTNFCLIRSDKTSVVRVDGDRLVGVSAGTANITILCQVGSKIAQKVLPVRVVKGSVASVSVTADETTVNPGSEPFALTVQAYGPSGSPVTGGYNVSFESSDTTVASVDKTGLVTVGQKEGSCRITVTADDNGHLVQTSVWIIVTSGKTEPTIYSYEERKTAQENVMKYDWAWAQKEAAVEQADFVVEHLDKFYDMLIPEALPRATAVYHAAYTDAKFCDYCGVDLTDNFGVYPWIVDPINNPWKITCPACKHSFPSNDFASYYASGLDEEGVFSPDRADSSLLVNTTFPDKPADWGVDDGFGWYTGEKGTNAVDEVYWYIAYYLHMLYYGYGQTSHDLIKTLKALTDAYVLTGDETYGTAGAILLSRTADIYPDCDMSLYAGQGYCRNDGFSGKGKFAGAIDEGNEVAPTLARAADAFWPAMDNEDAIAYLREKAAQQGIDPEAITPDHLRSHVDDHILREIRNGCYDTSVAGNFGMPQESMALAAVALDSLPETEEMIDWVFRYGDTKVGREILCNGGNVLYNLVDLVDRNGFGNEISYQYNRLWYINLSGIADALDGYTAVEGADLWKNAKFVDLFRGYGRTVLGGRLLPAVGEAGSVQSPNNILTLDLQYFLTAYQKTNDPFLAKMIYAGNGNSVNGLHADIYTPDPESGLRTRIQTVINTEGELDMGSSAQLAGFGLTMLRKGPAKFLGTNVNADKYFNNLLYFGKTGYTHGQLEALNMGVFAFGLDLTSSMGYPTTVSSLSGERQQFIRNTVSHNTVVVDDEGQLEMNYGGFPMHYDDAGVVQLTDVDCSNAYAQTDIYRRTLVTVEAPNGVPYTVDFFRVLGGSEHVYSFHAVTDLTPDTEGLSFIHQPMGSYAGPDVPYGLYIYSDHNNEVDYNQSAGYSWLKNVYRDNAPETSFTVDWKIKDFNHLLSSTDGIHLRLTMHSDAPMSEVALADAVPPQNSVNPDVIKYLLVRNSGAVGQDTLFTSVIEPYQNDLQVVSSKLVDVVLTDGREYPADRAAAICLTMADGRTDYVVYATNADCTYEVDGKFAFSGFVGVCSYYDSTLVYAYGNEATVVADAIKTDRSVLTGTVTDFTQGLSPDGYTITVELEQNATEQDLVGRCIYVENDRQRNAVYSIQGAQITGRTAVLDIGHETLVRSYLDGTDLDMGFIHNIAKNASFRIPLSSYYDVGDLFSHLSDQVIRTGNKLSVITGIKNPGVTYEADGIAIGMKFDAANGQLIWTPAKAQAGRYPIGVKAVKDGKVIGETSFVIYAVAYSGSSYTEDVCVHAKAVTYDGTIVCPACGTITKKAAYEVELFDIAGANMTLGNELKLNILVENEKLGDGDYTVKITHDGQTVEKALVPYNSSYAYAAYSVCAKQMSDVITAEVYKDGVAVSNVYETSVRNYAMNILNNPKLGVKVKTLVVDMLNYGAEAQKFFGYNASDLANAKLNAAQKDLATKAVQCKNYQVKGTNFYGANVSLEDRIILNLFFKNCSDGMTATVTYTDYNALAVSVDARLVQYKNDIYKVAIDEIVLADAFSPVTVTVYKDGAEFGSATDSVESYVARTGAIDINEAIMKFAYSAKQYLG